MSASLVGSEMWIRDSHNNVMRILDFRNKIQRDISNNKYNYISMLLYDPQITLLCPIYHPQYKLLGLIVIGRRNDLDPYRSQDIEELQNLINASSMAYGNSYLYTQKSIAERTVRELFSSLKDIQDITAKKIAREIHDEIINVNIKLNIETIQHLITYIDDQDILDQLNLLLTGEKDTAYSLRMICESLHPSGIDDPLGFIPVLSNQIDQIRCIYKGVIDIIVINEIIPVKTSIQHEIIRVIKEAVLNSIKHANATNITIEISYPSIHNSALQVIISDNGSPKQPVLNRPGHFGIRNMKERIYMIGGRIEIQSDRNTGTCVHIFVPLNSDASVEQSELLGIYG
ncbi:sensor histidine kinase, partial [Herpetosiphon llansteffanensis]|uniref:sensor histidine kinase n=1 Tax=Herpetosiphon llansteffanensis TaxID=2094568 RepID=UPI001F0C5FDC